MAQKLLKAGGKRKVAARRPAKKTEGGSVVLVGTYREKQLDWIKKSGVYNYPLTVPSASSPTGADKTNYSRIKELWLYAGAKAKRHCFAAEFVGIQSKAEFLAANPTYAKKVGKPSHAQYAVFKTKPFDYGPKLEGKTLVARAIDFAKGRGQTRKIAAAIKQFHADGEFALLAAYLPTDLAKVSRQQLRVCEAAVQLDSLENLMPARNIVDVVNRVSEENGYSVIDLFAGAGGLSLGFEKEGFRIALAVEKDAWAAETYKRNHRNGSVIEGDIVAIDDKFFRRYRGKIDVVMGGPPCQGFSIAASNRRKKDDARNALYKQFLRVVAVVSPKIVLIENVKEIVGYKLSDGTRIVDDIATFLKNEGYVLDYQVLDCKNYGVPQDRRRFFCLAVKHDLVGQTYTLSGLMREFTTQQISFYEAISDLPKVMSREIPEGAVMMYTEAPRNEFQRLMRNSCNDLHNHVPMRHTPKTVEKFIYLLKSGGQKESLPVYLKPHVRGDIKQISDSMYSQNHRIIDKNKVSPTITASFYSSFIHPEQPRNLTVREAARIQTFPDDFVFFGKKTTLSKKLLAKKGIVEELHLDQFNQVGNAVPPVMAGHLARICEKILQGDMR